MPDFGIGEAILGLGALFGGEAAAGGAAAGAGLLGAGEAAGGAALGAGAFEGLGAAASGAGAGLFEGLGLAGGAASGAGGGIGAAASGAGAGALEGLGLGTGATEAFASGAGAAGTGGLGAGGGVSAGAAGTAGGSAGSSSVFGNLLSSATANPLQTAGLGLGAAGLGYNIMQGQSTSANARKLSSSADTLNLQGKMLSTYLETGKLPTGLQAAVGKANEAAKARAIQNAARAGMPTDPSQNSALAQDLNNIDQQSIIQTAEIGQKLLTTGINEIGLADNLYAQLVAIDQKQAANTGNAIMNFAGALAGGRPQQRAAA